MTDLRDQLVARFGPSTAPDATKAPETGPDPLGAHAHLDTDWIRLLRTLAPQVGQPVKPDVSLEAAKQLTDRTLKALKDTSRGRERSALDQARSDYLKRRDRIAWGRLKDQFTDHQLSDKAYRALKQTDIDPEKALRKLKKLTPAEAATMSAARLRDALSS